MWQTWQNNVDGGLIWHSNYWTSKDAYPEAPQNPYQDPISWVTGHGTGKGQKVPWGAGDGRLIYPPEACFEPGDAPVLDGPVPSVRWEAMRDGMEDFEYLVLLKKLLAAKGASPPESEQKSFAALLQVPSEISKNLTEFTQDPAPIEARRLKIAKAIEVLQTIK
jgi:hypothetical protein